jgi:hypothetical protein
LILGVMTHDGDLVVAGGTGPLTPDQRRAIAALLDPPVGKHGAFTLTNRFGMFTCR